MLSSHFEVLFITMMVYFCQGMEHDWTYELSDIKFTTSDKNVLNADIKIERLGRDDFALFGTADFKEPITDDTFIEMTLERSATGTSDYKVQPYKFPGGNLTYFMNNVYKKYLMSYLTECAPEAPQFEIFAAPLTPRNINVNSCKIGTDLLPPHIQSGFYKLNVMINGQVDVKIEVFGEVEEKGF